MGGSRQSQGGNLLLRMGVWPGSALSRAEMDEAIREFMDEIGPDAGHLTDD